MNFNEYQIKAETFQTYPSESGVMYCSLALCGESGEIANKIKKVIRGDYPLDVALKLKLTDEAGDVLWYLAALCSHLGITLDHVANSNIRKLSDRRMRGVLKGDGDDR